MPNTRSQLVVPVLAVSLACAMSRAHAVAVIYPGPGQHIHMSVCPAVDGVNVLVPDPIENVNEFFLYPTTSPTPAMVNELAGGDTAYPGWTFQSAISDLTGTFYIDEYKSRFFASHHSGCIMNARYKRGPGDPTNLRWVQLVDTSDPIDPNGAAPPPPPAPPYIDPYPDDADGEGGPFYYSDQAGSKWDYRKHINGAQNYGFGTDYDIHFLDVPKRPHPPTSFVEWHGELWLTELTPVKNVIFHNGIQYGFQAACINWGLLVQYVFGTTFASVSYDVGSHVLTFSPAPINVLNQSGNLSGVDPSFVGDPMLNAQMIVGPFTRVTDVTLPQGLALFRDGSIQVFAGTSLLYTARIPFLVLGDGMNAQYNMTGVYAVPSVSLSAPSPFLQQYEAFRHAGLGSGAPLEASDRSDGPAASEDPAGTYPHQFSGHSTQLYALSGRPIDDLLTNGGFAPASIWNSFGSRNPDNGLLLRMTRTSVSWGSLGTAVRYDPVYGDLGALRATGGNFTAATLSCLGNDTPALSAPFVLNPGLGQGYWLLVRGTRGPLAGTYDTLQPSQIGSRDAEIAAFGGSCP